MIKVVISGSCFSQRDVKYIKDSDDLKIIPFPKLGLITNEKMKLFKEATQSADLVIVALCGSVIDKVRETGLERIGAKKALWTFDSHHSFMRERIFQKYFDTYFVAHSQFCDKFDKIEVEWLPACFIRFDIDCFKDLRLRSLLPGKKKYNVVFPFKPYKIGNRNSVVRKIVKYLDKLGLNYYSGPVTVGMPYMNMIIQSQIVLNVSLLDDLNIRNFEVWGLNRPLLANGVTDHDKITNIDFSKTYLFERNLSNFEQMLQKAIANGKKTDTSTDVLNNHMLIHRYVKIINRLLKTNYKVVV